MNLFSVIFPKYNCTHSVQKKIFFQHIKEYKKFVIHLAYIKKNHFHPIDNFYYIDNIKNK